MSLAFENVPDGVDADAKHGGQVFRQPLSCTGLASLFRLNLEANPLDAPDFFHLLPGERIGPGLVLGHNRG